MLGQLSYSFYVDLVNGPMVPLGNLRPCDDDNDDDDNDDDDDDDDDTVVAKKMTITYDIHANHQNKKLVIS